MLSPPDSSKLEMSFQGHFRNYLFSHLWEFVVLLLHIKEKGNDTFTDERVYLLVLLLGLQKNGFSGSNLIPAGNWMHVYDYILVSIFKVTFIFSLLAIPNPKHYR